MSKGYTGCIDLERISNSLETLSSIESCINNTDLTQYIEDIEKTITDTNFEHGNCIGFGQHIKIRYLQNCTQKIMFCLRKIFHIRFQD